MASIRSFLIHVHPGARERVAALLRAEPGCDVFPSTNSDVLVLVTDLASRDEDDQFDQRLSSLDGVAGVALVAGYRDDAESLEP